MKARRFSLDLNEVPHFEVPRFSFPLHQVSVLNRAFVKSYLTLFLVT